MYSILEIKNKFQDKIIDMASDIHGHNAPGIIFGTKMVLYGLSKIKITEQDKVIVVSENVKCLQDAALSICYFLLKKNNWRVYPRVYDVGKFSIQIIKNFHKHNNPNNINKSTEIFRVVSDKSGTEKFEKLFKWLYQQEEEKEPLESLIKEISKANDDNIFKIVPFTYEIAPNNTLLKNELVRCPRCGENAEKNSMIKINSEYICRICVLFK